MPEPSLLYASSDSRHWQRARQGVESRHVTRYALRLALALSMFVSLPLSAQRSEESMRVLLSAAANGSAAAQYSLGASAEREGNYGAALAWYRLAANNGYAGAQYNLGLMLEAGRGTTPDLGQARQWFSQAAAAKFAPAQAKLAALQPAPGAASVPSTPSNVTYTRTSAFDSFLPGTSAAVALTILLAAAVGLRLLFAWMESSRGARNAAVARSERRSSRG